MTEATKEEEKVETVEIEEKVEVPVDERPTEDSLKEEGMLPEEIEMHKEHGLLREEKEEKKEEKSESKAEEKKEEKAEEKSEDKHETTTEEELVSQILDGKEPSEDELDKFKSFTPNVRKLYRQQKRYQRRAQDAESSMTELKNKLDLATVKSTAATKRIEKLNELLSGEEEGITQEAIKEILKDVTPAPKDDNTPITKKDLQEIKSKEDADKKVEEQQAQAIAKNLESQVKEGQETYGKEEFDRAMDLADEIVKQDKTGVYAQKILSAAAKADPEQGQGAADIAMALAKLHPDFGKSVEKADDKKTNKEEKSNIDKIIRNSDKKPSSATVTGSGRKTVSVDDLTADDVLSMDQAQWNNLPDRVRDKIMQEG